VVLFAREILLRTFPGRTAKMALSVDTGNGVWIDTMERNDVGGRRSR
jgi:hypothetical protein